MSAPDKELASHSLTTERNPRLRLIIPFVVAIAFFMEQLDSTIIVTAVPDMARSLGSTPLRMNTAVTAYVLTLAMLIPVSGWFADRFGARRVFALALFVFTLGSALCGLATSFPMLIATRCLQGLGGAMMTPVGRLIVIRSFPRNQLVTAMTYMTLPAIIGPVIGPLLGGVLTTYASWRWIFFVNIPFGIVGVIAALRFVEDTRESPTRFDFPGFLMVGSGLVLLQYAMDDIGHPSLPGWALACVITAAIVLLAGFAAYSRLLAAPAIDLTLFRQRSFSIGTLAGGLARVGFNGVPFLLPLMLQVGFGMSAVVSGSLTFASALSALLVRPILVRILKAHGFKSVLCWSALAGTVTTAGFSLINPNTPYWITITLVFAFGLARSGQFMTSNALSYSDSPASQLSRATSLGAVLQQLSISFGVSIAAMMLGLISQSNPVLTPEVFHEAFLMIALFPVLAIPGFMNLKIEDGAQVSGHVLTPTKSNDL